MKFKIDNIRKILNCLYEMLFASLVIIFISVLFFKENATVAGVVCIIMCIGLSYLIREIASNELFILLLHILCGVIIFFLPIGDGIKYMTDILIVFFMIPASLMYVRRNSVLKPQDDAPWPSILIVVIIYLFGLGMKNEMIADFAYISVMFMLVLYLFMSYCYGIKKYMDQSTNVAGLPISEVLSVNSRIVAFTSILVILFMIGGRFIDFTVFYNMVYNAVVKIIRVLVIVSTLISKFISGLFSSTVTESEDSSTVTVTGNTATDGSNFVFLEIFVIAVAFLIIIYLLFKILKRIFKMLLKPRVYDNDIVMEADLAKKDISEKEFDKIKRRLYISKEERARNIYRKTVLAHKDDINLNNHITCQDIKEQIENSKGNVDELTSIYEEIRYNGRQVENSIIKRMTKLSREDKKHER